MDLKNIKENQIIHCKTQYQFNTILDIFNDMGLVGADKKPLSNMKEYWNTFKEDTYLRVDENRDVVFGNITWGNEDWQKDHQRIPFEDIVEKKVRENLNNRVEHSIKELDEAILNAESFTAGAGGFLDEIKVDYEVVEGNTPKHYDNSKGSLYKIASDLNLNAYQFDILKRVVRAEKKGEFESDIDKTIHVLKLWKEERLAND